MKKVIIFFLMILFMNSAAWAKDLKTSIDNVLTQSNINRNAVSISIKDYPSGRAVYELNPKMPVPPASIQKIVTSIPAFMLLGDDYTFSTKIYKNKANEYLVVLGADPYLSSKDLDKLVKSISKAPAAIYIDDTVIDKNEWGEGWQWDDDLNPLMPKFSAYNIDKNLMEITISPTVKGFSPKITTDVTYPLTFINNIITSNEALYTLKRQNHISPDVIIADGTIKSNKSEIRKITVNDPKKYFKLRLSESIINHGISSSGIYQPKKLDNSYTLVTLLSHEISKAKNDILKSSNNLVSETLFKIAGGKYANQTGSFENGMQMFNDFCKKQNINTADIKLADASGVSKNNLMTSDFMTEFLCKSGSYIEQELPVPGEGTLSGRMLYFQGMLSAKTGTLSNISSITGYVTTRTNRKYVFCIIINDSKTTASDKKIFEEYIIRTIYTKG